MNSTRQIFLARIVAPCMRFLEQLSAKRVSARPLALFRIGLAGILLVQTTSLVGYLADLYGRHGIVDWTVTAEGRAAELPQMVWFERAITMVGLPAAATVPAVFAAYLAALFCLMIGYRTRLAAGVVWLTHAALLVSSQWSMYGIDQFAQIGLFYCLVLPVGHALSVDSASGRVSSAPSFAAWLGLKVLQTHVCIAYVASGVEKGLGEQWWNGEAVWRALMSVHDPRFDYSFMATVPGLAVFVCWMTLLLEAGAIAFIFHPITRKFWLIGILGMHLGIALLMNLWAFSAVMIVFDVAAFGIPVERRVSLSSLPIRLWYNRLAKPISSYGSSLLWRFGP